MSVEFTAGEHLWAELFDGKRTRDTAHNESSHSDDPGAALAVFEDGEGDRACVVGVAVGAVGLEVIGSELTGLIDVDFFSQLEVRGILGFETGEWYPVDRDHAAGQSCARILLENV